MYSPVSNHDYSHAGGSISTGLLVDRISMCLLLPTVHEHVTGRYFPHICHAVPVIVLYNGFHLVLVNLALYHQIIIV